MAMAVAAPSPEPPPGGTSNERRRGGTSSAAWLARKLMPRFSFIGKRQRAAVVAPAPDDDADEQMPTVPPDPPQRACSSSAPAPTAECQERVTDIDDVACGPLPELRILALPPVAEVPSSESVGDRCGTAGHGGGDPGGGDPGVGGLDGGGLCGSGSGGGGTDGGDDFRGSCCGAEAMLALPAPPNLGSSDGFVEGRCSAGAKATQTRVAAAAVPKLDTKRRLPTGAQDEPLSPLLAFGGAMGSELPPWSWDGREPLPMELLEDEDGTAAEASFADVDSLLPPLPKFDRVHVEVSNFEPDPEQAATLYSEAPADFGCQGQGGAVGSRSGPRGSCEPKTGGSGSCDASEPRRSRRSYRRQAGCRAEEGVSLAPDSDHVYLSPQGSDGTSTQAREEAKADTRGCVVAGAGESLAGRGPAAASGAPRGGTQAGLLPPPSAVTSPAQKAGRVSRSSGSTSSVRTDSKGALSSRPTTAGVECASLGSTSTWRDEWTPGAKPQPVVLPMPEVARARLAKRSPPLPSPLPPDPASLTTDPRLEGCDASCQASGRPLTGDSKRGHYEAPKPLTGNSPVGKHFNLDSPAKFRVPPPMVVRGGKKLVRDSYGTRLGRSQSEPSVTSPDRVSPAGAPENPPAAEGNCPVDGKAEAAAADAEDPKDIADQETAAKFSELARAFAFVDVLR